MVFIYDMGDSNPDTLANSLAKSVSMLLNVCTLLYWRDMGDNW